MFVDFQEVKQLASLQQVADWLGLELRNNRCQCPVNEGDKRELVLTPEKSLWYCFGCKTGGDQIALVAHVNQVEMRKAALDIQTKFHGYTPDKRGLPPDGLDYLEFEHPLVQALGITKEKAELLGVGYAPRGTMIKRVLFPLRDKDGALLGYVGFNPDLDPMIKLPSGLVK